MIKIGILGFHKSGKTTVFNALTGSNAEVSAFVSGRPEPNVAVVKIPDERVDRLAAHFQPKKVTYGTIEYIDLVGISKEHQAKTHGLGETQLTALATADALLVVVRAFEDESGIPVDVGGDVEAIELEMILSDLEKVEHRLPKLEKAIVKVGTQEREALRIEQETLGKVREALQQGQSVRSLTLPDEEEKSIRGFQFLSQKPLLFLINIDEETLTSGRSFLDTIRPVAEKSKIAVVQMCGKVEMEIAQLDEKDRDTFLQDYHLTEPAAQYVMHQCYDLLGLIPFFTVNPNELHVWTVPEGLPALKAAGTVHSDFERGFIRAEVIQWEALLEAGSFAHAKKMGTLRTEGKEYPVKDGDVINFLFSV
jgi:GTP-binding protein YchF